jgi:hypothetical protein
LRPLLQKDDPSSLIVVEINETIQKNIKAKPKTPIEKEPKTEKIELKNMKLSVPFSPKAQ